MEGKKTPYPESLDKRSVADIQRDQAERQAQWEALKHAPPHARANFKRPERNGTIVLEVPENIDWLIEELEREGTWSWPGQDIGDPGIDPPEQITERTATLARLGARLIGKRGTLHVHDAIVSEPIRKSITR